MSRPATRHVPTVGSRRHESSRAPGGSRFRATGGVVTVTAAALALLLSGAAAAQVAIPVLCYHGFTGEDDDRGGQLDERYERYEEMLSFLAENGFRTIFPDEVGDGPVPERAVIITFDDGRREQLRAAEMLERHGFRGLFFVVPQRLEVGHEHHLTSDDAARLARAGHRVAAHGYAHRNLVTSGRETAASLARSPRLLAAHVGADHPMSDFAFPFGHYGREIVEALRERYPFLHTVNPGYWDGVATLVPRLLVARDIPLEFYTDYLLGAATQRAEARLLTVDGGTGERLEFELAGPGMPADLRMLVIAADRDGRMYADHPLDENAWRDGGRLVVDLRAHLERYYPPDRTVISYALVTPGDRGLRYLTTGYLHWLE